MDHRFKNLYTYLTKSLRHKLMIMSAIVIVLGMLVMDMPTAAEESSSTDSSETSTTTTIVDVGLPPTLPPTTSTTTTTTTTVKAKTPVVFTPAQIRYLRIMHVNNIVYIHGVGAPAMEAFRIVATERGWTPQEIKSWEIAIANIMMGESGFCPNLLRGARIANPHGCVLKRQGKYEDAGFGQLIGLNYRISKNNAAAGWLCRQEKLCSKWDIIASPWNSMTALVALIERSGTFPWCYNSWARKYHRIACNNPGMDV